MENYLKFEAAVTFGAANSDQKQILQPIRAATLAMARTIYDGLPDNQRRREAARNLLTTWHLASESCIGAVHPAHTASNAGAA
jgi:hypothetical protein